MMMFLRADARSIPLRDQSANCVITSPPYWGLRDYGVDGQIGLESTVEEYVSDIVSAMREVWRVLRDDGTLWLNLGDTYFGDSPPRRATSGRFAGQWDPADTRSRGGLRRSAARSGSLKPKDLVGVPWRVAFALQDDGWWLRRDIIWWKPNPIPESVRDRPTTAHEYVFLLTKRGRGYYYNAEAIMEPSTKHPSDWNSDGTPKRKSGQRGEFGGKTASMRGKESFRQIRDERNKRSVWTVPTRAYRAAHFATFPPDLIEPMILAGCPEGGIVMDPFVGSGTTVAVARKHRRIGIGLDLSLDYIGKLGRDRVRGTQVKLI